MRLTCAVNGGAREADDVQPGESLLFVLRERPRPARRRRTPASRASAARARYARRASSCARASSSPRRRTGAEVRTVEGLAPGTGRCTRCRRRSSRPAPSSAGSARPGLVVAVDDLLARDPDPTDAEIREALAGNLCRCTGYQKILDAVRLAARRHVTHRHRGLRDRHRRRAGTRARRRARRASRTAGSPRSGAGAAAPAEPGRRAIDGRGCLATPGLVNCHHHLYQSATRGLAQEATLFEWLVGALPGVGARRRGGRARGRRAPASRALARSGCTTTTDHHYIFPRGGGRPARRRDRGGRATSASASTRAAARWTSASRDGGLPPDGVVEDGDAILAASEAADRRATTTRRPAR